MQFVNGRRLQTKKMNVYMIIVIVSNMKWFRERRFGMFMIRKCFSATKEPQVRRTDDARIHYYGAIDRNFNPFR